MPAAFVTFWHSTQDAALSKPGGGSWCWYYVSFQKGLRTLSACTFDIRKHYGIAARLCVWYRYVLLKERNMLLTLEQEAKRQRLPMPSPERLEKVGL